MSILHKLAPLAAASVLLIGFVVGATAAQTGLNAATAPQPGVCETAAGQWALPTGAPPHLTERRWP